MLSTRLALILHLFLPFYDSSLRRGGGGRRGRCDAAASAGLAEMKRFQFIHMLHGNLVPFFYHIRQLSLPMVVDVALHS